MSDLVTGEAVPLELRLAKLPTRVLSISIDLAMLLVVFIALNFALAPIVADLDPAATAAVEITVNVVVFVGIQTTVETLTRGKSAGKAVLGLRVVRDDGGPIRFRHALTRWLVGLVVDCLLLGTVAIICSLLNERGKRVGDILAGTVVVRERTPSSFAPLPPVPYHLASWAEQADIAQLPDGLSIAARNYLARARELDPQVRDAMGVQLMRDMSAYVSPQEPPGTPAWAYLAAVLGERHRREMQRLAQSSGSPADPSTSGRAHPQAPSQSADPSTSGRAHPQAPSQSADQPAQHNNRQDPPTGGFAPPA